MTLIVPDVNVLVYAFRADADEHATYAEWLNGAAASESIGLCDAIVSGFLRIATDPRIMRRPAPLAVASSFIAALSAAPRTAWLTQGSAVWDRFYEIAAHDTGVRGKLVPDAYIAAACLANGAQLATRDRGFARFAGLDWFDPATPSPP